MQTEVLRLLRADAQSWWRYRELRRTGDLDEARRQERQTIRRDLGYLRATLNNPNAYVSCGGGGTILHLGLTTVSLYAPVERFPLASLAVRLGTPLIDCRPVRDIIAFANLPKVTMDGAVDPEPLTSSSRVSLLTYLDMAERLGVRIINDPRINHAR
ncbi:hypothetical protein JQT66_18060 [Sulfitobacter mediterraneus]|uniref:hypothetical protein n=1 Tax=Sulfitobacter mediterraneus TaxID=83219 RepID=UPI001932D9C4|nr:hypothetical protein [Sulfitobacter mediterraneus]MBM1312164.1 hypothetical protein [Sulfitobacter mediterraneus]MBM1316055.1 hypothetical protein [Sulfitobacter mediterraneus]MBM1324405.1 hypothetical protein [Sulfitobacter mediterraneus]MBM1328352.1 hypothetical protein [Sulfitobacter mediterraneus]MBM1399708.1 hypothetical protein [Sulfitobacter mediterraneus]